MFFFYFIKNNNWKFVQFVCYLFRLPLQLTWNFVITLSATRNIILNTVLIGDFFFLTIDIFKSKFERVFRVPNVPMYYDKCK